MMRLLLVRDGVDETNLPEDIADLTDDPLLDHIALLDFDAAVRRHEREKMNRASRTKGRRR